MKRLLPLLLLLIPQHSLATQKAAARSRITKIRSSDFHPNPNFKHVKRFADGKERLGGVEQMGEIVILEGDDVIVSTSNEGFGVVWDGRAQNPVEIANRFYTQYGDQFDEIFIFTTFEDIGAQGAAAYEISTQQNVDGIGQQKFDDSGSWGSNGTLFAFVNMMKWDQFDWPTVPLLDPRNDIYSTMAQEFAHRWLSFLQYKDKDGNISTAMLGRDQAHWASTMQADGSVMDGNVLTLDPDGSYVTSNFMTKYSSLDLYGMGLIPAEQVQPWFLLKNVTNQRGRAINGSQWVSSGSRLKGNREDITIDQVIAAEGPRKPSSAESTHSFRVAFVLVTHPGERAGEVMEIARTLDKVRVVWEQQFKQFTAGTGTMCTQVSAPCGAIAAAHVDGGEVVERGGNNNGVAEPGEPVLVSFHLFNDTQLAARQVTVTASGHFVSDAPSTVIGELPPDTRRDVVFAGSLPKDIVCGEPVTIEVDATVDGHTFRGFAQVNPGLTKALELGFESGRAGWAANPDGHDSAVRNGWAFGTPVRYGGNSGWTFQPNGCHGNSQKCWFTGLQKGTRGMHDSSLAVGESRLYSHLIDLSKTYQPVLKYWAWFQAIDFSDPEAGGQDAQGVTMVVEGSTDGGKSWVTLDTVEGSAPDWRIRQVTLEGLVDTKGQLLVRFVANNPIETTDVEAGIDDLTITTLTPACRPLEGQAMLPTQSTGGCHVGGASPSGILALLLLAGVALVRRRRA